MLAMHSRALALSLVVLAGCDVVFGLGDVEVPEDASPDAPPGACVGEDCLDIIAIDQQNPTEIAVNATHVVWTNGDVNIGRIAACTREGCSARYITSFENAPHSMFLDGDRAIWLTQGVIVSQLVTIAEPNQAAHIVAVPYGSISEVFRFGDRLYRIHKDTGVFRCDYNAEAATCSSSEGLPGGGVVRAGLAAAGSEHFWTASEDAILAFGNAPDEAIVRERPFGHAASQLVVTASAIVARVGDERRVFVWPTDAPDDQAPDELGMPGPVVALARGPAGDVYVATTSQILRIPTVPSVGVPETLVTGLALLEDIAVAPDGQIYVISGDRIARLVVR